MTKEVVNFKDKFDRFERELKEMKSDYRLYKKETTRFLKECTKYGINLVSIGVNTKKIKRSSSWGGTSSVIAGGDVSDRKDGFPAIWSVISNLHISGSCGNGHQHYVNDKARLIEGVYEFKNNQWRITK